jgi:DUF971 family protein
VKTLIPQKVQLRKLSQVLELHYPGESPYQLGFEFLRVHSPSAEVKGHGNPILQTGKKGVQLLSVEASGNYALKLTFSDGHDSGLFSWDYLRELCLNKDALWQDYLKKIETQGATREPSQ